MLYSMPFIIFFFDLVEYKKSLSGDIEGNKKYLMSTKALMRAHTSLMRGHEIFIFFLKCQQTGSVE